MNAEAEKIIAYFTSSKFIASLVVLFVGLVIISIAKRACRTIKEKRGGTTRQNAYIDSIYRIIKWVITVIVIFAIMQCNDIPIGQLVAGVGVASIVIGFALQDTLKDLMMGLHIMSDESLRVGDCVKAGGHEGTVLSFSLTTTKLRDLDDGTTVFIPNRQITEVARSFGFYDFDIKLSSCEAIGRVEEVFGRCADELDSLEVVRNAQFRGCAGYENDAVLYRLRIYFKPVEKYEAKQAALNIINRYIQENGIRLYAPHLSTEQN